MDIVNMIGMTHVRGVFPSHVRILNHIHRVGPHSDTHASAGITGGVVYQATFNIY
jgi:hypothetical protein